MAALDTEVTVSKYMHTLLLWWGLRSDLPYIDLNIPIYMLQMRDIEHSLQLCLTHTLAA